ncbi:hypothetical protein DPMN_001834 [Dreissena polymorpha]|uniref:Uncharacterized protein n=1 Tax=Dreissena polymorpha TaxID=45954 RepID=A0A9D4MII7_DREPO|nr:hypothetical protein DPMN_001834 [Dreissena polymorpha]
MPSNHSTYDPIGAWSSNRISKSRATETGMSLVTVVVAKACEEKIENENNNVFNITSEYHCS